MFQSANAYEALHYPRICETNHGPSPGFDPSQQGKREEATLRNWWSARTAGSRWQTLEGHTIEIIHPGRMNTGPGPDFLHARLRFNGHTVRGSVEIHPRAADWADHGHHRDARYNEVVLHVTADLDQIANIPAVTEDGRVVATLRIPEDSLASPHPAETDPATLPARCRETCPGKPESLRGLLWLAGCWRLLRKTGSLAERAAETGMEQTLYERIMAACGWGGNEPLMAALARVIPCERLRQMARQDPLLPEAALFHMAGLFPESPPESADPPLLEYWTRLRDLRREFLPGLKRLKGAPFPVRGRPLNRPERRLVAAARLMVRTAIHGVEDTLLRPWFTRPPGEPSETARKLIALFEIRHGLWESRCSWTGSVLSRPVALIGPDRALSMAGNIALPLALLRARNDGDPDLEHRVAACFQAFPAEADSFPLRWTRERLFGNRCPFRAGFALQQGLLQLYRDWCGHDLTCADCPVPRALADLPGGTAMPGPQSR